MSWPTHCHMKADAARALKVGRKNIHHPGHKVRVIIQAAHLAAEEKSLANEELEKHRIRPLRGVRREGESNLAVMACNAYVRWPRRSLVRVQKLWQQEEDILGYGNTAPTLNTFKSWSRRFDWQARAYLYDEARNTVPWQPSYQDPHTTAVLALLAQNELARRKAARELAEAEAE